MNEHEKSLESDYQKKSRITLARMLLLAALMFAFAMWVLPPLYTLFCEVTGLNGKTGSQYDDTYQAIIAEIDKSRSIEVQFVAVNNEGMPWLFKPEVFKLNVHPGERVQTNFIATNPTLRNMVGQAVPSVTPSSAAGFFHKTECFCFNQQPLAAKSQAELGLEFIVDQALPKGITTITLSYTLFDVTETFSKTKES